jgi:hypothetical protein
MTAEVRDSTILPPPEPRDPKGTRPALDLAHLARQVRGVQTVCAWVEAGKSARKKAEKGEGK